MIETQAPIAASLRGAEIGTLAALSTTVAACGGGGGDSTPVPPPPPTNISADEASRFLAQASMGATRAQIARVQALGYAGWLDEQFALPQQGTRWDWLVAKGFDAATNKNGEAGFDASAWRKLIASPDTLRQRVTLALSEIVVTAIDGLVGGGGWKAFCAAAWLDMLEANAFGNYRALLQDVSRSTAMGLFLTFRGNVKADAVKGTLPDENYAREVMQLFTIGLQQLNADGSPQLVGGQPQDTYGQDDIAGLARVFTGWDFDLAGGTTATPDYQRRPMIQVPSRHESGAKSFLGTTIGAGTNGATSLGLALDAIFAHPNVAPFVGRQLIQRLVTSNPSPAYVARVAAAFDDDGAGTRATCARCSGRSCSTAKRAASRPRPAAASCASRCCVSWPGRRAFNATSASDAWAIGNTSDPGTRLGQSPLRSPSVFNFFRPGYVPPNSAIGSAGLVAPEFQITNESSVVGYVNYMQRAVSTGIGDLAADYTGLLALADDAQALLDELNLVLAAGQIGARQPADHEDRTRRHGRGHRRGATQPGAGGAGAGAGCARVPGSQVMRKEITMQTILPSSRASRRAFLRQASALSVAGVAAPWALNLAALGEAAAATATDYKALVCVFLYGGNDYGNTLVPVRHAQLRAVPGAAPDAGLRAQRARRHRAQPDAGAARCRWLRAPVRTGTRTGAAAADLQCRPPGRAAQRRHADAADKQGAVQRQVGAAAAQAVLAQ